MMHLDSRKLELIRAIAEDARGDPATRAVAQRKLAAYAAAHPYLFHEAEIQRGDPRNPPPRNPPNPRTQPSPESEKFRFMNMDNWSVTANGNHTIVVTIKGENYRIVLFRYKKTPTWGWVRYDPRSSDFFSGRFATLGEAQRNAWQNLTNV